MALTRYKLGDLIDHSSENNSDLFFGLNNVKGISIKKMFIETKADMQGVPLNKYLIVKPDYFAYVTVTSRNGEKITLAHNTTKDTYLVSSTYEVFKVKDPKILNSDYLFMFFNRFEFDRYSRFNSWGSAREVFSWDDMCDIDIDLPDLPTQQKYVDIYNGMIANQKSYESGLEDLKLVCDGYIEDLRRKTQCKAIAPYVTERREKNTDGLLKKVLGISNEGFINPKQDTGDLKNYWIFKKNDFVYSPPRINVGSIGLYKGAEDAVCSPIYVVFYIKNEKKLYPEYLDMWLHRKEFFRSTDFFAIGSVRNNFSYDLMSEVSIPVPDIEIQKSIACIYKVYLKRKQISENLKEQIKNICPILIKGSIEEAKRSN